jgi:hypothetical protein
MDYFRGLNKAQEVSQRALDATARVIEMNAGNYSVWYALQSVAARYKHTLAREMQP